MKKLITIGATVLAGLTLAACGVNNSSSSNSSAENSNRNSASSHGLRSTITGKSPSSSSSHATITDPKVIGILAYEEVYGKDAVNDSDDLYFSANSGDNNNGNDGAYLISSGSTVGTISFSVNGDQVTIYKMDENSGDSDADAQYTSSTISLKELEDKYYSSSSDQDAVQSAAQNLKNGDNSDDDSDSDSEDSSADDSSVDSSEDESDDVDDTSVIMNQQQNVKVSSVHAL